MKNTSISHSASPQVGRACPSNAAHATPRHPACSPAQGRRLGFTALELLIVTAMTAAVTGTVLPDLQKVRETQNETKARRSFKQLSIAIINYQSSTGQPPPVISEANVFWAEQADSLNLRFNTGGSAIEGAGYTYFWFYFPTVDQYLLMAEPAAAGLTGSTLYTLDSGTVAADGTVQVNITETPASDAEANRLAALRDVQRAGEDAIRELGTTGEDADPAFAQAFLSSIGVDVLSLLDTNDDRELTHAEILESGRRWLPASLLESIATNLKLGVGGEVLEELPGVPLDVSR